MIDHMLVNLKKYYEGKFPCYIGMNIKAPKSSLPAYYMADSPVDGADMLLSMEKPSLTPAELENKEVIAQRLNGLDDFYLLIQPAGDYSYINCWIKLSDLIQNGGVSASLNHVYHALTAFRSEVKSMIDHLLINLKKYYEGNEKNYIGKTINGVQNSIAAFSYTPSCDKNNSGFNERFERYDSFKSDFLNGIRIIGQATLQNGDILLMIPADYSGGYNQSLFVKLTDILKNGGVSHSHLTHSYRAFHLVRKEISMALMKMKYQLQDWYQGKMQNYIGRSVTLPKTKIRFYDIHDSRDVMPSGSYTDCQHGKILGNTGTVNGQFFVENDTFLTISFPFQFDYDEVHTVWLKLTDILQNGGVSSSPLIHLYQGLRHLLDRKVVPA